MDALTTLFLSGLTVQVETAEDPAWDAQFEAVYSADSLLDVPWLMVSK